MLEKNNKEKSKVESWCLLLRKSPKCLSTILNTRYYFCLKAWPNLALLLFHSSPHQIPQSLLCFPLSPLTLYQSQSHLLHRLSPCLSPIWHWLSWLPSLDSTISIESFPLKTTPSSLRVMPKKGYRNNMPLSALQIHIKKCPVVTSLIWRADVHSAGICPSKYQINLVKTQQFSESSITQISNRQFTAHSHC